MSAAGFREQSSLLRECLRQVFASRARSYVNVCGRFSQAELAPTLWFVAYAMQSHEMLFDAHARAFAAFPSFAALPQRAGCDSMK